MPRPGIELTALQPKARRPTVAPPRHPPVYAYPDALYNSLYLLDQSTIIISDNSQRQWCNINVTVDGAVGQLSSMLDHAVSKLSFRLRIERMVVSLTA